MAAYQIAPALSIVATTCGRGTLLAKVVEYLWLQVEVKQSETRSAGKNKQVRGEQCEQGKMQFPNGRRVFGKVLRFELESDQRQAYS